jgi:DNA-binding transcriptional regulator YhcF (GntR family)
MIRIIEHNKPNLEVCKIKNDQPLHQKLNKYEMTTLMNQHSLNVFIGRPKSGKTSFLWSLFQSEDLFKRVFYQIYTFMPQASQDNLRKNIFAQIPERVYTELNEETLTNCEEQILEYNEEHPRKMKNCIIIDDMTVFLKNKGTEKKLRHLINNRRHLGLSIFILAQTYHAIPKEIRRLINNMVVFNCSRGELLTIMEEHFENLKEDCVLDLKRIAFQKPHDFLFLNTESQRLFRNFDEIVVVNENNEE